MKWDEFILKIADKHNIDGAAKDFFLLRFGEDHIHDNDTQFKVFLEESETRQRALGKEDTSNKISSPNNFKIRETNPVSAFNKQIRSVYEKLDVSLSGIKDPYAKKKPDRLRRWLREEYDKESSSLRIFQPERNIDSEVLCEACYRLLETQRRVTTNSLMSKDGVTFEPDDLFVPLGLVERKKRPRRQDIESSDQGSQLYEATIDEITQTFTHQEFFDQVIRHGETKSQGKRIAIVGEPGAGKTTLLQKIGDWFRDNDQVPIWVSLADVGTKSLREYLLEDWLQNAAETIEPPSQEWKTALQQLLKSNQACLLLDGVDEMVVPNALRWIGEQLREGWVSSVRVVLTCRLNVWENSVLEGFDVYRNLDFDYPEQVRCFIDQFFKREGADPSLGEKLKEELEKSGKERIRDSIKNPLRLSLLCYSWEIESGELPATKAELYRQFVNAFYELKQKEFPITPEQQQELNQALGQLARASIDREDSRFRLRESFIKNLLGGDPQQEDTLFWKACRLGLLNYIGITAEKPHEKAYAFIHPTFQEYFAAISIESWKVFVGSILNEENEIHQESQKAKSNLRMLLPEWKEIISLWLGIISDDKHEREKKDFIEYVFKFQDNHYNNRVGYYTLLLISHWLEDYSKDEYINQLEEACEYLIREAFGRNSKLDKSSDLAFQALLKLPLRFVVEPLIKRVDFDDEHQIIHSDILHDWILEDRGSHPANSWEIRCQFSTLNDRDSFDDWFESEFYWNFRWLEALEALSIVGKGDSEVEKIIKDIILYCNEEYCNYPQELVEFLWFYWAEKDPRKLLDLYKELWVDIEKN